MGLKPRSRHLVRREAGKVREGEKPGQIYFSHIELLGEYQGVLVTDGYEGYAQVARQNGLTHSGCWAHARRKFVKARKVQPKGKVGQADKALKLIRRLYTVEQQARPLSADERLVLRRQQSQPIIDRLKDWLFSDTPEGAGASARIYSLIETAKANGLEPYEYMVKVLSQLPTATTEEQLDRLLPWRQEGAVNA